MHTPLTSTKLAAQTHSYPPGVLEQSCELSQSYCCSFVHY